MRILPGGRRIPNAENSSGHPALQVRTLHLIGHWQSEREEAESNKLADTRSNGFLSGSLTWHCFGRPNNLF